MWYNIESLFLKSFVPALTQFTAPNYLQYLKNVYLHFLHIFAPKNKSSSPLTNQIALFRGWLDTTTR